MKRGNPCSHAPRGNTLNGRSASPGRLRTRHHVPMVGVGTRVSVTGPRTANQGAATQTWAREFGRRGGEAMKRKGVAMVVVLIGLAVATTIFLSVLKLIAVQRQSVELQARQIQAGWLAESAVQRALARLSADANYRGETWNISAQDIGGRDGATIAIRVDDVPGKSDRRSSPRRGRLPGRSLPTGPTEPRGHRLPALSPPKG